ncbi:MAG: GGDEF domain-containing protein [Bacillota bacterium]
MRKIPGGSFFVAAGAYLALVKPLDVFTITAVILCAVLAGLSVTKHSKWAIIGGALMIAGSFFLQSVLSYSCMDCIRADILILAGIISLSILETGKMKKALRVMVSVMAVTVTAAVMIHTDISGVTGMVGLNQAGRYLEVSTPNNKEMSLDTAEKPVLFFSPTCGACVRAVDALVKIDPEGKRWTPVQAGEGDEGIKFLKYMGYRGETYTGDWWGAVPAMVNTKDGKTFTAHHIEEMVEIVVNKKIENLLLEPPSPELHKKHFPLSFAEFSKTERNIEKVYLKLEVAEFDLISQKARQAGENFNLLLSSTTDRLTGVPNRRQLDKQLEKLVGRMAPLSVIMMDIDHFKKVNDIYGHGAGDLFLKHFASTVKSTKRPLDFPGRYGGEEFMVICNTGLGNAVEMAERVRQSVSGNPFNISEGHMLPITASFGVSEFIPGDTPQTLLKRADNVLYEAKKTGRNKVVRGGQPPFAG